MLLDRTRSGWMSAWRPGAAGYPVDAPIAWGRTSLLLLMFLTFLLALVLAEPARAIADNPPSPMTLQTWTPNVLGADYEMVKQFRLPGTSECDGPHSKIWRRAAGDGIQLTYARCESDRAALRFALSQLPYGPGSARGGRVVLPNSADRTRYYRAEVASLVRSWAQDRSGIAVTSFCPRDQPSDCDTRSASASLDLAAALAGSPLSPKEAADNGFVRYGLFAPFLAWLTLVAPWRLGRRSKEGGYDSRDAPPHYNDVGRLVRRRRNRTVAKYLSTGIYTLSALGSVNLLLTHPANGRAVALRLIVFTLLARGLQKWSRDYLPPRRPARRASFPRRAAASVLQGSSNLLAAAALGAYLVLVFMTILLAQEPRLYDDALEQRSLDGLTTWDQVELLPLRLATRGGFGNARVVLMGFLLVAFVSFVLSRGARYLSAPTAEDVALRDDRPYYFLYLRSFDEDAVRIHTTFSRHGLIDRVAPRSSRRFEEVLVDELSRYAPVVAVSPPGARLPRLGAARLTLDNMEWKEAIEVRASEALAVVMSATPGEIRDGFDYELQLMGKSDAQQRLLLVLSPWGASESQRRFSYFLRHTASMSPFSSIAKVAQPGAQVLAHTVTGGWRAWGSKRHWDYTYAYSLMAAVNWALPSWRDDHGAVEAYKFDAGSPKL